jgi:acyl-CoA dehydrogenase
MDFEYSDRVKELHERLNAFKEQHIYPNENVYRDQVAENERNGNGYATVPIVEELKPKAREAGLWNLFLPEAEYGPGLTNLEYSPLAEIMGRVMWSSEVFNCSAPDTGNMEVLARYGNEEQKQQWLMPLLEGKIRSSFAMTVWRVVITKDREHSFNSYTGRIHWN